MNKSSFEIHSVSPCFGLFPGHIAQSYHYEDYQLQLRAAANRAGICFNILVSDSYNGLTEDSVRPVLDINSVDKLIGSIRNYLVNLPSTADCDFDVVVIYEASLSLVSCVLQVAQEFPNVLFLLNLFEYESSITLDSLASSFARNRGLKKLFRRVPTLDVNPLLVNSVSNVILAAESDSKLLICESLGFKNIQKWPSFSSISQYFFEPKEIIEESRKFHVPFQMLLPLSSWQIDSALVKELISIKTKLDSVRTSLCLFDYTLTGMLDELPVLPLLARLKANGFLVESASRTKTEYAQLFSRYDAVWFPNKSFYKIQASGKVLDSLVQGLPILAPSGSFAQVELSKWLPGAFSYSSIEEALSLLLTFPLYAVQMRRKLLSQNQQIRDYYSVNRSISVICEIINRSISRDTYSPFEATL